MEKKQEIKIPHTMAIMFTVMFIMAVMTYIIPSGVYDRTVNEIGKKVIDPNSFHIVKHTPVTIMQFLSAIPDGFVAAGSVVGICLFPGGSINVLRKIGIIDAAIEALARKVEGKGIIVIPILMFIFALIDCFIGTPELCVVYLPIVMPLMFRLGFDSITAMATVVLGSSVGFTAGIANPFTIVIAQKLCELPLYSGWQFRLLTFFTFYLIGVLYIIRYGRKVLAHPELSPMYETDSLKREQYKEEKRADGTLSTRQTIAGLWTVSLFVIMLYGTLKFGWDCPQMSGIFIAIGVGSGLICGMETRKICVDFADGCKECIMGALFVAMSRGVSILLAEGKIIDTIVYGCSNLLIKFPAQVVIIGIFIVVTILNFFIGSGSGKAVMLFPILSPLADVCKITRQTAILSYQFGDGITNMLWPTGGTQAACLGISGIPWNKWAKFYLPLAITWSLVSCVFLVIAQAIHLGPF